MNKTIDDYLGFLKGLERVKYAELRVSQEETVEEAPLERLLEGSSEEIPANEPVIDGKAQIVDEQNPVETTDNPEKNNMRKKSNPRK